MKPAYQDDFRYPAAVRILHWVTVPLLVLQVVLGLMSEWATAAKSARVYLAWHYQAGVALFALMLLRTLVRTLTVTPRQIPEVAYALQRAAR
jgi:cytochrome b561